MVVREEHCSSVEQSRVPDDRSDDQAQSDMYIDR